MSRRTKAPLEKRKNLLLFVGDWERLERICSTAKITPTEFIRELVNRSINKIESRAQDRYSNIAVDIKDDELPASASLTTQPE